MTIGVGLIEMSDDGQLFNTYVVAMPDGGVVSHRKIHCFISEHMSSGDQYTALDIPQGARVGVLICYDNNRGTRISDPWNGLCCRGQSRTAHHTALL